MSCLTLSRIRVRLDPSLGEAARVSGLQSLFYLTWSSHSLVTLSPDYADHKSSGKLCCGNFDRARRTDAQLAVHSLRSEAAFMTILAMRTSA